MCALTFSHILTPPRRITPLKLLPGLLKPSIKVSCRWVSKGGEVVVGWAEEGVTDAQAFYFFYSIHIQIQPPHTAAPTPGSDLWEKWFRPGSPQHSAGEEKMLVVD